MTLDDGGLADQKVYSTPMPPSRQREFWTGNARAQPRGGQYHFAATFAAASKRKCRPMSAIVLDAGGRRVGSQTAKSGP